MSKKNNLITAHSLNRFLERTKYSFSEQQKNAELAFTKGYKLKHFKEPFYSFLNSKQIDGGKYSVRVWEDYIYIFDNYNKKLVTVYSVPAQYKPIQNFINHHDDIHSCLIQVTSPTGEIEFVCEGECFTDDIAYATEFKTHQRANNYIKNNHKFSFLFKQGYKVDLIDLD